MHVPRKRLNYLQGNNPLGYPSTLGLKTAVTYALGRLQGHGDMQRADSKAI
jgi:hypothetical protein